MFQLLYTFAALQKLLPGFRHNDINWRYVCRTIEKHTHTKCHVATYEYPCLAMHRHLTVRLVSFPMLIVAEFVNWTRGKSWELNRMAAAIAHPAVFTRYIIDNVTSSPITSHDAGVLCGA